MGKIKDYITSVSNDESMSIETKIETILDYISMVSIYSYRNRRIAETEFMKWILVQNVKSIHIAEIL